MLTEAETVEAIAIAVNSHFDIESEVFPLILEGQEVKINDLNQWVQIKLYGPNFDYSAAPYRKVRLGVHLDLFSRSANVYDIRRHSGLFAELAAKGIPVPELEACLFCEGVKIMPKGRVRTSANLQGAIVEATYTFEQSP